MTGYVILVLGLLAAWKLRSLEGGDPSVLAIAVLTIAAFYGILGGLAILIWSLFRLLQPA